MTGNVICMCKTWALTSLFSQDLHLSSLHNNSLGGVFKRKLWNLVSRVFRRKKICCTNRLSNKGLLFSVENVPCEHLQSISRVTDHCTVMSSLNSECIQEMPKSIKTNKAFYYRRYRQQKKRENIEVGC